MLCPSALLMLLGLVAALLAPDAGAQARGDTLPDLSPREVEIRGALTVSFPSIARLPLAGFVPQARVRGVETGRAPTRPDYVQPALPPSPLGRPDAPQTALLELPAGRRGAVEGGAGSLLTRFGRLTHETDLGRARLFVGGSYRGRDGHTPGTGVEASGDAARAHVGVETSGERGFFRAGADGFFRAYPLFGMVDDPGATLGGRDGRDGPQRLGVRGGAFAGGDLRPAPGWTLGAHARFDQTRYDTGLYGSLSDDDPTTRDREARITGSAEAAYGSGPWQVRLHGAGGVAGIGTDVTQGDLASGMAGLDGTFESGIVRLAAGPRVLSARFQGDLDSGETAFSGYADLSVRPLPTVEVYARNTPHVVSGALDRLLSWSPYLLPRSPRRATLVPIDARGGATASFGPVQIGAWGGYVLTEGEAYAFEAAASGFLTGALGLAYDRTTRVRAGADVRVALLGSLSVDAGGAWQQAELDDGSPVPHVADAEGYVSAAYRLPGARGSVRLAATLVGPRDAAVGGRSLDAYLDASLAATYRVTPYLGFVAHVEGLAPAGNREQWAGYREAPITVGGGLQILW